MSIGWYLSRRRSGMNNVQTLEDTQGAKTEGGTEDGEIAVEKFSGPAEF
jgi:hypothetical protein